MIEIIEAKKIVKDYIKKKEYLISEPVKLSESKTITKDFGWVFFYNSVRYFETNDFRDSLAGNAPIIINKITGKLSELGTAKNAEYYIDEYENKK